MRHTRTWFFFFLPFLYLSIVLGFVVFQFSKKSDSFSQSLGDLTLSGKNAMGGEPAEITLRGRGLEFIFDANHYLQADGKDGTTARLRPLSWAWKDGNVLVTFQQGVALAFEKSEAGGKALLIRPVPGSGLDKLAALHIPFSPEGGVRLNRGQRSTTLELLRDKTHLLASVDGARDKIELDNTFVLMAGRDGFRPARLDPMATGMDTDLSWLTLDSADPADAEAALTKYWDKAYASWPASASFSSRLVDAWGREALLRNDYPGASSRFFALLNRDRSGWGFDAVPFLGNVVELTALQRRNVEAASSRSQPDWAGQGRLWLDAKLYGPDGSADRVKGLMLSGRVPDTATAMLALFQNLLTIQAHQPSDAVSARLLEVQKGLLSRVVRREGQLFVVTGEGLLDVRSTLILGRLWLDFSKTLSNEPYGVAGARLVTSALARQDAAGKLPEILVTQDGLIVRQEGTLLPEDLYGNVRPAPTRETELPVWGASAFVMTPSKVVTQQISDVQARFVFRFPTGSAEHIVIAGVPAFDHITMHGIRWRTDPQFQSYTDGWAYSAATKTLYVKIKHREDLEELIVHFKTEQ